MQRSFGSTIFEPLEESRDREITLGPVMLAALVIALLALCSLCFISGYAVGRNGAPAAAASAPSGPTAAQLLRDQPKPGATPNSSGAPAAVQPSSTAAPAADAGGAGSDGAPAATNSSTSPEVVHTALPAQPASAPVSAVAPVQSALPPAGAWMVQIAAVSNEEDADVLMSALRQRGYAVRQRRDPVDNLIHVQVGPLASENDAIAMRQRLLNDGYNAVIQH